MGLLNPLFLLAGVAVAVPIFLHLFQRHDTQRFSFPALRYLERTERERAREIKIRQLLLLLARVAVLLLLVGAGARLVFYGQSGSHPPTAVVIILDNSMSSGLVVGENRVLDDLKSLAHQTLAEASDEDLFWVIRAGEPWLPAIPGNATDALLAVDNTETSAASSDLTAALTRAAELLSTSELPNREVHLLSDLQQSAFNLTAGDPLGGLPVVTWTGTEETTANRGITGVLVGGGLPPLEGQRTQLTVSALENPVDTARWPVRVVVDGRIRGAGTLSAGAETTVALPLSGEAWIQGYADTDADALRADDRRYFAYKSRAAPRVAVSGTPGFFITEAMAVLEGSGRVTPSTASVAELLLAHEGSLIEERGAETAAVIIPANDITLLPALNRRLADTGIPWRYEVRQESGEAELEGGMIPESLRGVRVSFWFRLVPRDDSADESIELASVGTSPWALEGSDAEGRRYLLLASPLIQSATTLPVSTGMVRFIDWAANEWSGTESLNRYIAGDHLLAPTEASYVRFPSGREVEIDGTRTIRGTGEAGFYTFVAADTTLSVIALNPSTEESRLAVLDEENFDAAIGPNLTAVSNATDWNRAVFLERRGPELWWPFLVLAVLLLWLESVLASSGRAQLPERRAASAEASGASN